MFLGSVNILFFGGAGEYLFFVEGGIFCCFKGLKILIICDTSPNRPLDLPQTRFLQCFGKEIKNSTFIRAASVGVIARVILPNANRSD